MSVFDFFRKKARVDLDAVVASLVKNEIIVETEETAEKVLPYVSKIGGKPYLPANFKWPVYTSKDDNVARPLSFFCQINLKEIRDYDKDDLLPDSGMLYFFYECESFCWGFDPSDKGAAKVYYFENIEEFVPMELPSDLIESYSMPEIAIRFSAGKSYPGFEELEYHSDMDCQWEDYDDVLEKLGVSVVEDEGKHKLLGYADIIQDEMLSECERVSRGLYSGDPESYREIPDEQKADIQEKAKDWILLLQLGTITKGSFEWMFGDCGMLYFYIRRQDLLQKRFDDVWFSLQCG